MTNSATVILTMLAGKYGVLEPDFPTDPLPVSYLVVLRLSQSLMHVCEGVQHAHQKAIIHRDLKPSNILVTEVMLPSKKRSAGR